MVMMYKQPSKKCGHDDMVVPEPVKQVHAAIAHHKSRIAHHEREFARVDAVHSKDLKHHAAHKHKDLATMRAEEKKAAKALVEAQAAAKAAPTNAAMKKEAAAAKRLDRVWRAIAGKTYTPSDQVYKNRRWEMDYHREGAHRAVAAVDQEYGKLMKL